jgi:hypothetical protein
VTALPSKRQATSPPTSAWPRSPAAPDSPSAASIPLEAATKQLKRAFFLAAFASLAHPPSRAYYDRKRAQGKKHNAALICLARRRVDVLSAMLCDNIPYETRAVTT